MCVCEREKSSKCLQLEAKGIALTHNLGILGSTFVCDLESSDLKLITMEILNSIENGLHESNNKV